MSDLQNTTGSEDHPQDQKLADDMNALRGEIARLNQHRFVTWHNSLFKLGCLQFFKGLAFGLGSVLGATLLVSVLAYILASIDFIPIVGDLAKQILAEIKSH